MSEAKPGLLIVDDEPSIRSSMSQILTEFGYRVRSAADGRSALVEMHRQAPEVLISDLNMPGMSGFELLPLVRHEFPRIRLVAMSGAFSGEEIPLGVAADAFYPKSASMQRLLEIMESFGAQEPIAPSPHDHRAPIWMTRSVRRASGEAYVTIECPECLSTFPLYLNGTSKRTDETECLFCGSSIRYAVLPPLDPTKLKPFQQSQFPPKHLRRTMTKRMR
jgi:CheY-like chemotaxis protein